MTDNRDLDRRCAAAPKRRTWRLRLVYRWLVDGESFESLAAETGIDVEDLVRQLAKRKVVWRRVVRSEAWRGMIRA